MSTQQVNINKWQEICKDGFSGDKTANDFILYLESCSKKHLDTITWTTTSPDFQTLLNTMNISQSNNNVFSIQESDWLELSEVKRQVRTQWHQERQMQLKHHLTTCLVASATVVTEQYQRLEGLAEYIKSTDLGTVPFLRGLVGFLRYQLTHGTKLAEWRMDEYVLTQKDEDAMDRDIHVLKSILGFEYIHQDTESTVIRMDDDQQEEALTWRMNPDLSDVDINEILKTLPKDQNTHGYQSSHIERKHELGVFQWLYQLVLRCLSFF